MAFVPYVFGGVMLVAAMAFAGHQMGQNADAHNAGPEQFVIVDTPPKATLLAKGSLIGGDAVFDLIAVPQQEVAGSTKGDYLDTNPVVLEEPEEPAPAGPVKKPPVRLAVKHPPLPVARPSSVVRIAAAAATPWKLETTYKLKRVEKHKTDSNRRVRLAEENCLARAVYFEARSESELGQLAVAKVILNRVKDPAFPKTICGVVYQGAHRNNSCQFSFACDGSPDDPKSKEAWARSKRIAQKALDGDQRVRVMKSATFYHADYVKPKWARSMRKLIKIGRHIFYSDS